MTGSRRRRDSANDRYSTKHMLSARRRRRSNVGMRRRRDGYRINGVQSEQELEDTLAEKSHDRWGWFKKVKVEHRTEARKTNAPVEREDREAKRDRMTGSRRRRDSANDRYSTKHMLSARRRRRSNVGMRRRRDGYRINGVQSE